MQATWISARTVAKVVAVALLVIAAALLLVVIALHVRTTARWVVASIFLALALSPAVDFFAEGGIRGRLRLPRWLAILLVYLLSAIVFALVVLLVIPPIVREVETVARKAPGYVHDLQSWAEHNKQFQELNHKYHLTDTLSKQAKAIPGSLGDAAGTIGNYTVQVLEHMLEAITILVLAFFMLIDGKRQAARFADIWDERVSNRLRRVGRRIYGVIRSYVTVNLVLAVAAGIFTWLALELLGVELAVPLALILAFMDLIPLIGLTIGGLLVAVATAFHNFPTALIVWAILFLVYQQLQDRVIQPLMYRNAVNVHPVVAIVALLMGADLLGIMGALFAIPTAAIVGVLIDEGIAHRRETSELRGDDEGTVGAEPQPAGD